ncbi:MAG TPA: DUF4214 domain-containing protein [Pirellulales bacterium]|nr:DUF4214 domain-containing protein [Pirellulales bacterium]
MATTARLLSFSPRFESLEDRRLLTIDYQPVFGTETLQTAAPYTVMNNPTVNFILWGNWGTGAGQTNPSTVENISQAIINSTDLSVLKQYGSDGTATVGQIYIDSTNPVPADFQCGNVVGTSLTEANAEITSVVNAGHLPGPSGSPAQQNAPLYAIITDPANSHPGTGFNGGYNTGGTVNGQNVNIISMGTDSNFDNFGETFSHEMAEKMSDPVSGGVIVSGGANLPLNTNFLTNPAKPPSDSSNFDQIADFEPEPGGQFHYTYRIGGPTSNAIVQPVWSNTDSAFVVEDGNTQAFDLAPIWTNISGTNATFSNTYNLTINGDQLANKDDKITISMDSVGGVAVTMNGETTWYDPSTNSYQGTQLATITINGLTGTNQLTIDNSKGLVNVPITFNGGGTGALDITGDAGAGVNAVYNDTGGSPATGFSGNVKSTQGATTETIDFSGLSPVEYLTPTSLLTINMAAGATVENIVAGPTSTGIDPILGTTAPTYQVNYGGGGEPINWRNATTVDVVGSASADVITENLPLQVDAGSPNQLTTLNIDGNGTTGGGILDEIDVLATPGGVTTNTDDKATNLNLRVVVGGTLGTFDGGTGTLANINGAINVTDSGLVGGGTAALLVDDSGGTGPDTATVTSTAITVGSHPAIGYDSTIDEAVELALTAKADTVNVQSTNAGVAATILLGNAGNDTFNVSSTAPIVNGNGTLTGNLGGIRGQLDVRGDAGNDTLNVSDYGGPAGQTYGISTIVSTITQISATGAANILYNNGDALGIENVNLTGSSAGGNTYNIGSTTAGTETTVQDGDASASTGGSTFNITGDNLSAANTFEGHGGADKFFLNVAANLGQNAVAPLTSLAITGGSGGSDATRNQLIVNDNSGTARQLNFQYTDPTQASGNLNIAPSIAGDGLAGGNALTLPVVVKSMQTLIFNAAAHNDIDQVTGTTANDKLTVAEMPTVAGDSATLLPHGTVAGASVGVFLDGSPYLTAPPATIANSRPGVAGGGAGPDLLINGLNGALTLNGNGNTGAAGTGDQAVVYAASEGSLVDTGNAADIFGLGAGVLQAGFGTGNAYDTMAVSDASVTVNNNHAGALVTVNLNTASFAQAGAASSSQQPGLIVDGGDEAAFQASGIADTFNVTPSTKFNIQANGNLPTLTTNNGVPQGDQMNIAFPGSIDVFSDNASPPNVTLTGQTSTGGSPFGVKYSSIERVNLASGNGIVNIAGDNDVAGGNQNDYFKVRGGIDPFTAPAPLNGANQFSLQIGGSWDPATGNVGTPPSGGLSGVIWFHGVTRINASGGSIASFDAHGNAIPDDTDPNGVNALDITPYADNTPAGWGIATFWDQGNRNANGGQPNPDLLVFNGVSGVSENIVVQPSALGGGQVIDNNEATNTPIAVVNYTLNTNLIVNGSSPAGGAGDSDTLTLDGTSPGSAGSSGNEDFLANFAAAGTAAAPMVRVYDAGTPTPPRPAAAELGDTAGTLANDLYNLQDFSNFNTVNVDMQGGSDLFDLISGRADGSLTLNVDGGPPPGPGSSLTADTVQVSGSAAGGDSFTVDPGAASDSGRISTTLSTATAPTVLNFTGTENVALVGQSTAGGDSLTLDGTGGNDTFTVTPGGVGGTTGTAQVDAGPAVSFTGLGSGVGTSLTLNSLGGSDTFALTQAATGAIPNVTVNGSTTANGTSGSASITGNGLANTFVVNGGSANSVSVTVNGATGTSYSLDGMGSDLLDGVAFAGATLSFPSVTASVSPGSTTGSGTFTPLGAGGIAFLPVSYVHMSNPVTMLGGATLTVNATANNETVAVDGAGNVTVTNRSTGATNEYAAAGYTTLVIDTSGTNSQVTIASSADFTGGIQVNGTGSTAVTVTAGAAAATVNLAAGSVTGVVGGAISLSGVSNLTVNSAATALDVTGYGAASTITSLTLNGAGTIGVTTATGVPATVDYTPLSPTSAAMSLVGGGPAISITGFNNTDGNLTLNKGGNDLDVNFISVAGNNAITASHIVAGGTHVVLLFNGAGKWVPIDIGSTLNSLAVLGGQGNDTLTVDDTNGAVSLASGISFNGGAGNNSLKLVGTTAATADTYTPGPGTGQGSDSMTIGGAVQLVTFNNLAPVVDTVPGPLTVTASNANDAINYSADPSIAGNGLVSVNNLETTSFLNKTTLTLNALAGGDTINLNNPANPGGTLTGITVNGGGPTVAGDTLVVNGTAAVTYTPAAADATGGALTGAGPVTVSFTAIAQLNINGQGHGLSVVSPAGADTIELTPGATADSGSLTDFNPTLGTIVPVAFSHLGAANTLTLKDTSGTAVDSLTYNGTQGNDTFTVTSVAGGTIVLDSQVSVITPGVANLTLNGVGGDDQFNLGGGLPYTTTTLVGSDPPDSDIASLSGAIGAVTVNLGDPAANPPTNTTITGYGGTVTLVSISGANLGLGGNSLTAVGGADNNNLTYTPTGPTAGTFTDAGLGTIFNFTGTVGAFTMTGGTASTNQLTVVGSSTRNLFEIDQGARTVEVLNHNTVAWQPVTIDPTITTLTAKGMSGQDTFQVIPAAGVGAFPLDNLLINVLGDSGATGANNALVIGNSFGAAPAALPATSFVVDNRGRDLNSGTIRVYEAAVANPDIDYSNVQVVSPTVATSGTPNGNLLIMGPDNNEPNETQGTATNLGSASTINVANATIFSNSAEFPGVPADNDFYSVTAQQTGTLDFVASFQLFSPALLPAGGNLNVQVLDAAGNVIAAASGGAAAFGALGGTGGARVRIPAVAGQTYFVHVFGANANGTPNATVVNGYNLSIVDTPAIVPFNLELSRSVPAADAGSPDTGDLPTNAPGDDSGRSQFDNVTNDNTPRIYLRLSDGIFLNDLPGNGTTDHPPVGVIPIPFVPNATTPGFRVAIFDGNNTQTPVGFASQVPGSPGLYEFDFTTPLADGVHNLTAEVQMVDPAKTTETGFGGTSATLSITIDTVPPPVSFGSPVVPNSGLAGASDSGVPGQPATIVDRITNVSTPSFYGVAEANSIIRLYVGTPGGNVLIGQTTAVPIDGTNAQPKGEWTLTSNIDLNNPSLGLGLDGVRNIFVTAEDLAGNVSATQELTIFVDTQGPKVSNVNIGGAASGFPLFETKVTPTSTPTPTPLINSLVVSFTDQPVRVGPSFVYPAVNPILATTTANYALVGEHVGVIPITGVTFSDSTASGTPGMSSVTLTFPAKDTPLPDDTYTLTVSDQITDNAGNALQGSFNGTSFPSGLASGNGSQGQSFVGLFTVNSRAHLANYSSGTVDEDINGDGVFNLNNGSAAVTLGYPDSRLTAGDFTTGYGSAVPGTANGFDKLVSYGVGPSGSYQWTYDLSGTGGNQTTIPEPFAIDGLPVAGNFAGSPLANVNGVPIPTLGDQVGLFDGTAWYLDVLDQGYISGADIAAPATATHPAGKLSSDMTGIPFVGNFDGFLDLGTYQKGVMEFDLASLDPGHIVTGNWNVKINLNNLLPASIPFNSTTAQPVAGNLSGLGQVINGALVLEQASIGLYVTGATTTNPGTGEWYFLNPTATAPAVTSPLVTSTVSVAPGVPGGLAALTGNEFLNLIHVFQDNQLATAATDSTYQFGDQFSLPVIGNWDPPGNTGGSQTGLTTSTTTVSAGTTGTWITNLYEQILGRGPSATELANWVNQVQSGTFTPAQVAQIFVTSNEYRADQINQLYEEYLGRAADASGTAWWTSVWNANGGPEEVQAGIIGSAEFYANAGKQYPSLSPDAAWVTALYQHLLNRDVDPSGLAYWVNYIQTNSRQSVVLGFVTSDEYRLDLINDWFQTYLGRSADTASSQALLQQMQNGLTQDQLLTMIVGSQEYINKP